MDVEESLSTTPFQWI